MIPYGRQIINEADLKAVETVLRSDFLTQGPALPAFEQAVATRVGASHAIAVNSATSALHIACAALDLGPGAARMERLRSHGITRDPALMTHAPDGPWYYQQLDLGWNYRMTEMQAALGLSQLDAFIARRRALADAYDDLLADLPLRCSGRTKEANSSWHLYVIRLDNPAVHRATFEALRANGIGVNLHYIPVHLQPYCRDLGFVPGDFPASENYYARAISIPLHAGLTDDEQARVVSALSDTLAS